MFAMRAFDRKRIATRRLPAGLERARHWLSGIDAATPAEAVLTRHTQTLVQIDGRIAE